MKKSSKKNLEKTPEILEPRVIKADFVMSGREPTKRVLVGIPMTGLLRSEWHLNYISMGIPTNWSNAKVAWGMDQFSPIQFSVANARNIIVHKAVTEGFEWLIFFDHDVIMPLNTLIAFNQYMIHGEFPIVGGLYFTKSVPAEPLIYRGRGTGYFAKWKMGDIVWCDGMGLGCHMLSVELLKLIYEDAETYEPMPGWRIKKIFHTPMFMELNEEGRVVCTVSGTEDLPFYEMIKRDGYLKRAGWPELQRKKYPFVCDTSLFCKHIDHSGTQYPAHGEEGRYK